MKENNTVSIIVPVYKVEQYLNRCINSIIQQSYKNLEIILVDDGSPDNCGSICDGYAKTDSRVIVVHQENAGLSGARNHGIDASTGDYLVFVDSDDFIHPDMIKTLVEKSQEYNSDITICGFQKVFDENDVKIENTTREFVLTGESRYEALYNKELAIIAEVAWNKLYKKEVFFNIRYPVGRIHEDEFIICDLINNADRIAYVLKPLYYYVQRENSIMKTFNMKRFDMLDAYKKRIDFFEKKGMVKMSEYTKYARIISHIAMLTSYSDSGEKDANLITDHLEKIKKEIKELKGSKQIPHKWKARLLVYDLFPTIYEKKICQ